MEPYRPPGSVSTVSVTVATDVLADDVVLTIAVERVERERARLAAGLAQAGWRPGPSVTNFLLVGFDSPERCGGGRRGPPPSRARPADASRRRTRWPTTSG